MKDVLFLDQMYTPKIILFLYWISSVLIILGGLTSLFTPYTNLGYKLSILIGIVIALILNRVFCELTILLFNIYKELKVIADSKK